jgi:hypothetical protein
MTALLAPTSPLVRTAMQLAARHGAATDAGRCTSCGRAWPCPALLNAVAVHQAAGLNPGHPLTPPPHTNQRRTLHIAHSPATTW